MTNLNKNFFKAAQLIEKIFFPFYKSKDIKKLFKILETNQPKNKKIAMFVGGCVRKYLTGQRIDDIDIATVLSTEEIKQKFKDTDVRVIETGVDHGSVTLLLNKSKFELTTLRKDIKTDGRHAEIMITDDWLEDSNRRDLTINAIYLDKNGKVFDPHDGQDDLKKKIIKFIGDPNKRIQEDYLRILRFIRFSIEYDSQLFSTTHEAIKLNLRGIKNLSKERILSELLKIIKLKNFNNLLDKKDLKNIFLIIFPEFNNLECLTKIKEYNSHVKGEMEFQLILSAILINNSNNHEYFFHKYNIPNTMKANIFKISTIFEKYKDDRDFLTKNLKKNVYLIGKIKLQNFIKFLFLVKKNFSYSELRNVNTIIDSIKIPDFPFSGDYLIKKGIVEGKKIGLILKELEDDWISNNYSISEKKAQLIIDKFL